MPVEEQTLPNYALRHYFPLRPGRSLVDRYRIITKLGYGAFSTVWLARDERIKSYAAVKVFVQDDSPTSPVGNELSTLKHMQSCPGEHDGANVARLPTDQFELDGPTGKHHCVVMQPQGCSLWGLRNCFDDQRVPWFIVWPAMRCLFICINWLVLYCKLIHTEITAQNVLMRAKNEAQFEALERDEILHPSAPVMDGDYPIYPSRGRDLVNRRDINPIVCLTDFGSARTTDQLHTDWYMPDTHRAPEIVMGVPWDDQIDVWSIGIMAAELVQNENLFYPIDAVDGKYVLPLALAQYISVMGPPPLWMIEESTDPAIKTFFDDKGQWVGPIPIPEFSLEAWLTAIPPGADKDQFVSLLRKIFVWDAAVRANSNELFLEFFDWKEAA